MIKGTIFDIQRFSIHDGHGIRTTLFIKGCPLKCMWCHNPEGINKNIQLWYFANKCIGCHKCIASCPQYALSASDAGIDIDRNSCINRGRCTSVCPTNALSLNGREMTIDEVVHELLADRPFYEKSGGGITLSGGEPTSQPDFALAILEAMKAQGISTALETSMYCKRDIFEQFIPLVDQFIVDLKLFDPQLHQKYTGVSNERIKDNFLSLATWRIPILVRIPMIPSATATMHNIEDIASFVYSIDPTIPVELMNYNPLANDKYRIMNLPFLLGGDKRAFTPKEMEHFYHIIENIGLKSLKKTTIG